MATRPTRKRISGDDAKRQRCESHKECHDSYEDALTAAETLMQMDRAFPGCHLTPYNCARCGCWHLYNRRIYFPPE